MRFTTTLLLLGLITTKPTKTQPLSNRGNHTLPEIDLRLGDQAHRNLVVNGRDSDPKPWMARIGNINDKGKFVSKTCSSTLVNLESFYSLEEQFNVFDRSDFILTAAHCLLKKRYPVTHVQLNTSDTNDGIIMPIKHTFFTSNISNLYGARMDIGVVQTNGTSKLTSLELAELGYPPAEGNNKVMVLGWGRLTPTKRTYPFKLQVGRMTTSPIRKCQDALKKEQSKFLKYYSGENTLCVIANLTAGDCSDLKGDSGGPLIMHIDGKDVIVGIVSSGDVFYNGDNQAHTSIGFYTRPNTQESHEIIAEAIKYFHNQTVGEIANALNLSRSTIYRDIDKKRELALE